LSFKPEKIDEKYVVYFIINGFRNYNKCMQRKMCYMFSYNIFYLLIVWRRNKTTWCDDTHPPCHRTAYPPWRFAPHLPNNFSSIVITFTLEAFTRFPTRQYLTDWEKSRSRVSLLRILLASYKHRYNRIYRHQSYRELYPDKTASRLF
jgi:hypothetical protein